MVVSVIFLFVVRASALFDAALSNPSVSSTVPDACVVSTIFVDAWPSAINVMSSPEPVVPLVSSVIDPPLPGASITISPQTPAPPVDAPDLIVTPPPVPPLSFRPPVMTTAPAVPAADLERPPVIAISPPVVAPVVNVAAPPDKVTAPPVPVADPLRPPAISTPPPMVSPVAPVAAPPDKSRLPPLCAFVVDVVLPPTTDNLPNVEASALKSVPSALVRVIVEAPLLASLIAWLIPELDNVSVGAEAPSDSSAKKSLSLSSSVKRDFPSLPA